MVTRSLAPEDPSKKNLFSKTLPETGRETGISQTAYTPLYPLFQCFFRLSSVKNYFHGFFDSGVSENTCFSRKFKPLFGASPLDTSQAFWEFFTDGISEKIKKGTI